MLASYLGGMDTTLADSITYFGIKVFILAWIVFVPIVITSRLEKIIKLLEERK